MRAEIQKDKEMMGTQDRLISATIVGAALLVGSAIGAVPAAAAGTPTFSKEVAPRGSRLGATAHFDNSANNKWNPNPEIDVRWGEQSWQEMQYSGITYNLDRSAAPETAARGSLQ